VTGFLALLLALQLVAAYALIFTRLRHGLRLSGAFIMAVLSLVLFVIAAEAYPILARDGAAAFFRAEWDPARESYGALQALAGTLVTSAIAVAIAAPLAVGAAVLVNEILPARARAAFSSLMDLMATVPTVVYGLWGLTALGPFLQCSVNALYDSLARGNAAGALAAPYLCAAGRASYTHAVMNSPYTLLTAGALLAVMITPYAAAVIRDGYALIPRPVEEAIYAVGATKLEAVLVKLRCAKNYIAGGLLLALGRAMGETVAVAMVVGGSLSRLTLNPLDSGITISSLIALQFPAAAAYEYMLPALFAAALLLAACGLSLNIAATYLIYRQPAR
jgi:phosphate transport system permease protein